MKERVGRIARRLTLKVALGRNGMNECWKDKGRSRPKKMIMVKVDRNSNCYEGQKRVWMACNAQRPADPSSPRNGKTGSGRE